MKINLPQKTKILDYSHAELVSVSVSTLILYYLGYFSFRVIARTRLWQGRSNLMKINKKKGTDYPIELVSKKIEKNEMSSSAIIVRASRELIRFGTSPQGRRITIKRSNIVRVYREHFVILRYFRSIQYISIKNLLIVWG